MNATRRRMLSIIAGVPIVGPLASKLALDQNAMNLMSPTQGSLLSQGLGSDGSGSQMPSPISNASKNYKAAFNIPWFKDEVESIIYEEQHHVYRLDADLAGLRSLSLAAKITFQRQRNVKQQIEGRYNLKESTWDRLNKLFHRLTPFSN